MKCQKCGFEGVRRTFRLTAVAKTAFARFRGGVPLCLNCISGLEYVIRVCPYCRKGRPVLKRHKLFDKEVCITCIYKREDEVYMKNEQAFFEWYKRID